MRENPLTLSVRAPRRPPSVERLTTRCAHSIVALRRLRWSPLRTSESIGWHVQVSVGARPAPHGHASDYAGGHATARR